MPRYLKYFLLAITANFFLSACVYGPKTEEKSALDILSEKNYQAIGWGLGVPVIKAKRRSTIIEGSVYITDFIPLKFEKLRILDNNGLTILETTTTQNGSFKFQGYLINGEYLIKIDSKKYFGKAKITVDDYRLKNIVIKAKPNNNRNWNVR